MLVLILDEFTAHLNVELEEKVCSSIRQHLSGVTVIEITHRLEAVREADFKLLLLILVV